MDLKKIKKVYFIGIGGIGISAVARIFKSQGKEILGSDAAQSEITDELSDSGIKVIIGQKAENISADLDLIIYTVAASLDNPERQRARELKIFELSYPQILGELMKDKFGIGVSGTDGKTTTTAMLAKILIDASLDPTVVVGSKVECLSGNSRIGQGKYFIFEGDEYKRAFKNYFPKIAVITNIKADHLDYFKDLDDIKSAFSQYLSHLPESGYAVINQDDKNAVEISRKLKTRVVSFGIDNQAEAMAQNIKIKDGKQQFDFYQQNEKLGKLILALPARYNVYNALAAATAALILKIDFRTIKKSLAGFKGAWRRFEKLGKIGQSEIIVDYAHTPYAVSSTIEAIKEFYPGKRILFVFQPHQYARTKNLFKEFVESFSEAEQVIISDIFFVRGRENPADFNVSSEKLANEAKKRGFNVIYGGDLPKTEEMIRNLSHKFDIIMMMGAGDIYELAKKLIK